MPSRPELLRARARPDRHARSRRDHDQRVRLGLGVLNLPFYTPVLLAEQLATLDYLSRGRLDVGVGLGWARDEYAAVGVPFERRGSKSPSRKPRPPILVGGYAEAPLRRAVTLGDGYISGNAELSKIEPLIGGIRRLHRHRGRGGEGGAYVLS